MEHMESTFEKSELPDETTDTDVADRTALIPMYHVVLLDDNDHSYEYVIEMLMALFGHSESKAYDMACEVDSKKRVIVDITYKERAEMKRDQIQSFGADWRIPHCKGSMSAIVEPVK